MFACHHFSPDRLLPVLLAVRSPGDQCRREGCKCAGPSAHSVRGAQAELYVADVRSLTVPSIGRAVMRSFSGAGEKPTWISLRNAPAHVPEHVDDLARTRVSAASRFALSLTGTPCAHLHHLGENGTAHAACRPDHDGRRQDANHSRVATAATLGRVSGRAVGGRPPHRLGSALNWVARWRQPPRPPQIQRRGCVHAHVGR